MRIITLKTIEEKAIGLQYKPFIEDETLWVFPDVGPRGYFHSRNVPEPFEIAFLTEERVVIMVSRVTPPSETIEIPEEAVMALESKPGNMARWGIFPGTTFAL